MLIGSGVDGAAHPSLALRARSLLLRELFLLLFDHLAQAFLERTQLAALRCRARLRRLENDGLALFARVSSSWLG
jgi:hypothetical protein